MRANTETALIDIRAEVFARRLEDLGFKVIALPPDARLSAPVASHPDLLFCRLGDSLVCRREYIEANPSVAERIRESSRCRLVLSDAVAGDRYPDDVGLCALPSSGHLFCRAGSILPELATLCEREGVGIADVSQGYSACSCIAPAPGHIITADLGIARRARELGLCVLTVSSGGVSLPPYEYGFIGGASGVSSDGVYFFGDPLSHPDGEAICRFIEDCGKRVVALGDGGLEDFGKILFI